VSTSGYSGAALPRKLGIKEGDTLAILDDPGHLLALLAPLPQGVVTTTEPAGADVILACTRERAALADRIGELGRCIFPDGACWIAWPKRSSGVLTDVTEDTVRELALPLGLVDNKVCAIDETWSGLRLVWRRESRRPAPG
jgi:hypothetical protein